MATTLTRSHRATAARVRAGRAYARRLAAELSARFPIEKIILFGSYAYGTPNRHSDVDLFFLARERPLELSRRMDASIVDRLLPLDLVVLTPHELHRRLLDFDPFLEEILARGIVLYARKG